MRNGPNSISPYVSKKCCVGNTLPPKVNTAASPVNAIILPSAYINPLRIICLLLATFLLKKPIAVTFVHNGQGLIVVIKPKIKAVSTGKVLVERKVCKNSIIFYL